MLVYTAAPRHERRAPVAGPAGACGSEETALLSEPLRAAVTATAHLGAAGAQRPSVRVSERFRTARDGGREGEHEG